MRAIRNTARRGSRDPSIANEHRSIFTFISFPSVHATRSYHSPVTSIRYQSLKREYLICFRVERGTVPLSCSMQKQSESFDQCFSSSSTGEKKEEGSRKRWDRWTRRDEQSFLSLSLSFCIFLSFPVRRWLEKNRNGSIAMLETILFLFLFFSPFFLIYNSHGGLVEKRNACPRAISYGPSNSCLCVV